jgi:hypothetical protein
MFADRALHYSPPYELCGTMPVVGTQVSRTALLAPYCLRVSQCATLSLSLVMGQLVGCIQEASACLEA